VKDKTWPGFASVIRDSDYSNEQVTRWFGISEDTLLTWYSSGAPIPAHLAIRARTDLGYCDEAFHGWRVEGGWLIAPNNRKISIRRLSKMADLKNNETLHLVQVNS